MKKALKVFITLITLFILVVLFYYIAMVLTVYTGFSVSDDPKIKFVNCLKENDIVLVINDEESSNSLKILSLFDYLEYFNIVNCAWNGDYCLSKQIETYPSWIINGKIIREDIDVFTLSEMTNCKL